MKFLILTEDHFPNGLGGGITYLKFLEQGLKYHKKDYEIICPRYYKNKPESNSQHIKRFGLYLRHFNSFFLRSIYKMYYYPIWYFYILLYLIKDKRHQDIDCIISEQILFSGAFAIVLGFLFKKRVILTMHGRFDKGLTEQGISVFLAKIIAKEERLVVSNMDLVICVSRDIKDYYLLFNKNSVFVPNFIDISKYKKRKFKKLEVIAYIGRLSVEKKVEVIVKTAQFFPEKKFWIIGDGPEKENLENLSKELNLKNVEFLGRRDDVPKLHQKIDLVVYIWPNEPFGLSALEAMASGIPVIAADTNEMHYFVGETKSGLTIPKDKINENEVKDAIKKLEDKNLYKKLSQNAFKTSKEYDYRKIVLRFIELLKKNK